MRRSIAASVTLLASILVWGGLLLSGAGPWPTDAAGVLAADLLVLTAVAVVGVLIGASRWARRLALGLSIVGPAVAVTIEVGPVWWVGLAASAAAAFGFAGNATLGVVRALPTADGPTPRVVAFSVALAAIPGLVASVSLDGLGVGEWVVIGWGAAAAALYAKAAPFALLTVRAVFPLAALAAAFVSGWPRGVLWVVLGVAVAGGGWRKEARLAVRPLVERVRAIPMLPELVPTDVLDAAGLDRRGRPRE